MITKVYGHVDGVEILFTPSPDGSTWTCTIPRDKDGEYIVDLYAVNDTGAESYYATVLFTVKGVVVTIKWLQMAVSARMSGYTVTAKMLSCTRPRKTRQKE